MKKTLNTPATIVRLRMMATALPTAQDLKAATETPIAMNAKQQGMEWALNSVITKTKASTNVDVKTLEPEVRLSTFTDVFKYGKGH